jgi:(1->4)-alpha-D-glucan 1-alpha-D-glucosylmutase
MGPSTLARLCALHGVANETVDPAGVRRAVPDRTRRALLRAMGVAAATDAEVARSLAEDLLRPWGRATEPVAARREDQPVTVALTVPAHQALSLWRWTLLLEDGTIVRGEVRPADLPLVGDERVAGERRQRFELDVGAAPPGYHWLVVEGAGEHRAEPRVIIEPAACYDAPFVGRERRIWGPGLALTGLRSARDWGVGDYTDLRRACELWTGLGAKLLALDPIQALAPRDPDRLDPYLPSSRCALDTLLIDVEAVADLEEAPAAQGLLRSEQFQAHLRALRGAKWVDCREVAAVKLKVLDLLYQSFRERQLAPNGPRAPDFRAFVAAQGEGLGAHALFEALLERQLAEDPARDDWRTWPAALRRPDAPAVRAFAAENGGRVEFFLYLQWQAELQLASAACRMSESGPVLGLYPAVALGVDARGAEAWAQQDNLAAGVRVGPGCGAAQEVPFIPRRLREAAYAPLIAALRRVMRHAGAVRLANVAALDRQLWVPVGGDAPDAG